MDFGKKAGDLSRWFEIEGDKRSLVAVSVLEQAETLKKQVETGKVAQLTAA